MSFFGSSPVQQLVDKATSEYLLGADWQKNMEICDMINSTHDGAKDAVKQMRKKLKNKNPKVVLLTLTLVETCVKNCGGGLHAYVASREFMEQLVKLVDRGGDSRDLHVYAKVLELVQLWGEAFRPVHSRLPLFSDVYDALKRKGHTFGPANAEAVEQLRADINSAAERRRSGNAAVNPQRGSTQALERQRREQYARQQRMQRQQQQMMGHQGGNRNVNQNGGYNSNGAGAVQQRAPQTQGMRGRADPAEVERKLHKDLAVVRETTQIMSQMLAASAPGEDPGSNEVLTELATTCREMAPRLVRLISEESARISPQLMAELLELNDDVQRCVDHYNRLLEGESVDADTLARQLAEEGLAERERNSNSNNNNNNNNNTNTSGDADLLGLAGDAPPPAAVTSSPSRPPQEQQTSSAAPFALAPPPSATGRTAPNASNNTTGGTPSNEADLLGADLASLSIGGGNVNTQGSTTAAAAATAPQDEDDDDDEFVMLARRGGGGDGGATAQPKPQEPSNNDLLSLSVAPAPAAAPAATAPTNTDLLGMFATPQAQPQQPQVAVQPQQPPAGNDIASLDPFAALATPAPTANGQQQQQTQAQGGGQLAPAASLDEFDMFLKERTQS